MLEVGRGVLPGVWAARAAGGSTGGAALPGVPFPLRCSVQPGAGLGCAPLPTEGHSMAVTSIPHTILHRAELPERCTAACQQPWKSPLKMLINTRAEQYSR